MSVSRSGSTEGWEHFEHQDVSWSVTVSSGNFDGTNGQRFEPDASQIEPAGGSVRRDELGELVAVTIESLRTWWRDDTGGGADSMPTSRLELNLRKNGAIASTTTRDETQDGAQVTITDHPQDDQILRLRHNSVAASNDDTNGGLSPQIPFDQNLPMVYNLREEYGQGPLFEDDDVVELGHVLAVDDADTETLFNQGHFKLIWHVDDESTF